MDGFPHAVLSYHGKHAEEDIRRAVRQVSYRLVKGTAGENRVILGDGAEAMLWLIEAEGISGKVDLVYIDPPFGTGNVFTVNEGHVRTVSRSVDGAVAYVDQLRREAYLEFLRRHLILIRDVLSRRGTLYLHVDARTVHYVKVVADEIFGGSNFLGELVRVRTNPKNYPCRWFGRVNDRILVYAKTGDYIWNDVFEPYTEEDIRRLFPKVDEGGRRYTTVPLHAPGEVGRGSTRRPFRGILPPPGRHWATSVDRLEQLERAGRIEWSSSGNPRRKVYADERPGKRVQDVVVCKDPPRPLYPTQKPLRLLDLIVRASSVEGSVVLDCFCGSGTTLVAAHRVGRRFIGIDRSDVALSVTMRRLDGESPRPEYGVYEEMA